MAQKSPDESDIRDFFGSTAGVIVIALIAVFALIGIGFALVQSFQ